ncbi:MAG: LysE family transporter [Leptolyngbya sp. SIO4C1]|nr:LysE family transporter [Leptolyngbya sp. SIO4C1]
MLFWRGILLGLAIAAPVGPIGLLCIQRTLAYGRWSGLLSGLGAATADGCYGTVAAFGLVLVSDFLVDRSVWLRAAGGLFLCYLGISTFLSKPATEAATATQAGLIRTYLSTFILTLANPATILSFVLIFAGFVPAGLRYGQAIRLVAGVFLGSALWWTVLSAGVALLRQRLTPRRLVWINRLFGILILGFGMVALSFRG